MGTSKWAEQRTDAVVRPEDTLEPLVYVKRHLIWCVRYMHGLSTWVRRLLV